MRNTKTKGKTMTKALSKCHKRFIAHNEVQWAYADILEGNEDINEIKCNVKLLGCELGENYCPIHKCKYRSTNILLDREKLLEFKSMDLIDFDLSPIEQSEEDNINIKVARYIYEFLHTAPNYDNDIPIGSFLTYC